jgi:uncharacterized membrane protein
VNPFDMKAALLARHAQHVVVIHFPIALFITSLLFDLLARWRRDQGFATAAFFNLVAAAVAAVPALATGFIAWRWLLEGETLKGNLQLHLILGLTSSGLIWLLAIWRIRLRKRREELLPTPYLALALIAAAVIALTGHLGGVLSGVETSPG